MRKVVGKNALSNLELKNSREKVLHTKKHHIVGRLVATVGLFVNGVPVASCIFKKMS